ncbi:HIT family protein [Dactylosporangium sp. NPDC051485]|uniref:HIT family protein n=1 Tax=Dactylosporangium sp. NPDC051485 TaxID=3154846 RepID=UPI0034356FF3
MSSAIEVPDVDRCAFCDYLDGLRPYTILRRSDLVATLVTREQRGVAHLLVIPTRHCRTILDISPGESAALMQEIVAAAKTIEAVFTPAGIAVWQNNGIPANQTIPHVHFHVAGTLEEGGTNWGDVDELAVAETDAIAARLLPVVKTFE